MVVRQAHEITGPGPVLTPPKSDVGRRSVALPAFVLEALAEHLRDHVGDAVDAWLFTRPSGLPLRRADLSYAWKDACPALGLEDIRPPRSSTPRGDRHRPQSQRDAARADGDHRTLVVRGGAALPTCSAERNKAIADYLDDVIDAARRAPKSAPVRRRPN
jgi:hypothetical protein